MLLDKTQPSQTGGSAADDTGAVSKALSFHAPARACKSEFGERRVKSEPYCSRFTALQVFRHPTKLQHRERRTVAPRVELKSKSCQTSPSVALFTSCRLTCVCWSACVEIALSFCCCFVASPSAPFPTQSQPMRYGAARNVGPCIPGELINAIRIEQMSVRLSFQRSVA